MRRERRIGLGEAVNELARAGLNRGRDVTTFRQRTASFGLKIDVTDVGDALETLDQHDAEDAEDAR